MVTVSSYAPNVYITFTNCTIDVRGNFFMSNMPVNLLFDGCIFRVANTNNLFTIDYSSGSTYGCTGTANDGGDILIKNSIFTDTGSSISTATTSTASRYLFNVKSLFHFKLYNVTF